MRQNGYHLKKDTLVQEATPHMLGIVGELLSRGAWAIIVVLYILWMGYSELDDAEIDMRELSDLPAVVWLVPVILVGIFVIVYAALLYLDLKRRKYDVYTDSIFYTEGFLTKNYAFLPMERVSDIENTQSFWSRIFGLHDIIISSE